MRRFLRRLVIMEHLNDKSIEGGIRSAPFTMHVSGQDTLHMRDGKLESDWHLYLTSLKLGNEKGESIEAAVP